MTHCIRHRLAAFGTILLLLLLSGCQGGGSALVVPDGVKTTPETDWRTLLFDEMNTPERGNNTFQRDDDAVAEQMLECLRSVSENNAAAAEEMLTENGVNGYAVGAPDIRYMLGESDKDDSISNESVTCLAGHAIVPQELAGDAALWDADTLKRFADTLIENRCRISLNPDKPQADHVGFAKGEIGNKTFVLAVFR